MPAQPLSSRHAQRNPPVMTQAVSLPLWVLGVLLLAAMLASLSWFPRRLMRENQGLYRANETELGALRYYANSIAHLVDAPVVAQASGAVP